METGDNRKQDVTGKQDITDAIQALALESLGTGVVITDQDAYILYVNKAFESITGYKASAAVGQKMSLLKSGRQSKEFYMELWQAIEGSGYWKGTLWNKRRNGELYHERLHIRRFTASSGKTYYVGVFSDIGEQDELQRALIEAQKHELIATMAAGIAHNFNNYMQAILGYAELGLGQSGSEKADYYFSGIITAAEKSTMLVKEIMKFSPSRTPVGTPSRKQADGLVDLGATLRHAVDMAGSILPDNIALITKLLVDEPCIIIGNDPDIEQTILNLVGNARDALDGKQDARISVELEAADKTPLKCRSFCPKTLCPIHTNRHAILKVEDNGPGIPKEIRDKVFDPFFTTKDVGKGTGLGLASAEQIITRFGGAIWIDSHENVGSSIYICLPMLDTISYEI